MRLSTTALSIYYPTISDAIDNKARTIGSREIDWNNLDKLLKEKGFEFIGWANYDKFSEPEDANCERVYSSGYGISIYIDYNQKVYYLLDSGD